MEGKEEKADYETMDVDEKAVSSESDDEEPGSSKSKAKADEASKVSLIQIAALG
jgi:hypothetical protein